MTTMIDTTQARARWFHLTPGHVVIGLLAVEVLLFLAEQCRWIPKIWPALIAIAIVDAAILVMFVWLVVALVVRRQFQFSIRSLLVLVVVVAVPYGWLRAERHWNGKGWIAGDRRVCTFLTSYDIRNLSTFVGGYEHPPEESAAPQQFLAYLLGLEDAQDAPMDLYGRDKALSNFRYVTSADRRTVATVHVYAQYTPGSIVIWFGDNDDDHICITMTPGIRREYETAMAAVRAKQDRAAR